MYFSNIMVIFKANEFNIVKIYEVIDAEVKRILYRDTKNVAGIYCWENKLNNRAYVGRSINLCLRLTNYFRPSKLKWAEKRNSIIARSILKHGIGNFRLFILEVVPNYNDASLSDRVHLSYLEGLWVGRLNPAYNSAETGVGTTHNAPSASNTANRKAIASRDGRTTFIDCYDYNTAKSPGRSRVTCAERKAP